MQKTKTLSQLKKTITQTKGEHGTSGYRPKGGDEQSFFDQHKIEVVDDAAGNGDEVFKGTGVKVIDRMSERHGYSDEEGKKVYDLRKGQEVAVKEETELTEGENKTITAAVRKREPSSTYLGTAGSHHVYHSGGGDEEDHYVIHNAKTGKQSSYVAVHNGKRLSRAHFNSSGTPAVASIIYKHHKDHDINESVEQLEEGEDSHAQFQKYHGETAKLLKNIHAGLSKHYDNVTSKKGYNNGQAGWGHVSDIKNIHRQLQDIHDNILQHGEWAKPPEAAKTAMREETELDERSLTPGEMNKREDIAKGMKKNLSGFKSKYGKDAKAVMYATATKLAKEEVETEEDLDVSLLEFWLTLEEGDRTRLTEMLDRGLEQEILEFISEVDNG